MFASCVWAECDTVSYNSMLDGYVKSGMLSAARKMFDQMPVRDLFSWNVLIAGYAGNGDMDAARELFWMMPERDCVSEHDDRWACEDSRGFHCTETV
ncbi:hypothetical protein HPP92_027673 [Vanilla planifolia]|uniref:Pentatricopeptide repeat-containing protein n=1 Tax=Vanilla planifolia TaxID=51239 RepID=A0A835PAX6_VANPL|nr:hypothetical protein HPP92_027673 [Vanilla planifolia]